MFKFIGLVSTFLASQELLLLTELFSLSFKLYLLFIIIMQAIRTDISKKLLILLVGILVGSMIYSDLSWIPHHLWEIYISQMDPRIVGFTARLGWIFFVIQNQSLVLFLENLTQKQFTFNKKYVFSLVPSIFLIIFQLYFIIFEFNRPALDGINLFLEQTLNRLQCLHLIFLFTPILYKTINAIKSEKLPKILSHQLKTFIVLLILPYLLLDLVTNKLLFFFIIKKYILINEHAIQSVSTILITYALYYCCKKMIGLRFLNFKNHVESKEKFNFINNFKDILEQLSYVTTMQELAQLTQMFFQAAFSIPVGRTRLYMRKVEDDKDIDSTHQDLIFTSNKVEAFISSIDNSNNKIGELLKQSKIFIKDEIEFSNFYQERDNLTSILKFLDNINADIFLPIYERQTINAYIIVERNSRFDQLYTSMERDEMLVFTSYLSNIINILKHSNLDALLYQKKELQEELYQKHQEINQYRESIRSFLRTNKERKIGIVFYKGRRFSLANQAAQDLIGLDININQGHNLSQAFRKIAYQVQEYKSCEIIFTKDLQGNKLILSAIPSLEQNTIIILTYHPEASDIIKTHLDLLKDPSLWDYILYLETTESGRLVNQLVPGNSETLLNFKIQLLSTALSKKATLLELPEDDLIPTVEILHHISLRQNLHVIKLTAEEKNNDVAIKLFGINSLFENSDPTEPLLQKLDNIGTLFIQNIHFLNLETQNALAKFITYGFFNKIKSDHKIFSNVRIICSTSKNLQKLVSEKLFSQNLFSELKNTSISMPSIASLSEPEITDLAQGFTDQALKTNMFKNLLSLNDKDKSKLLNQRSVSLQELKEKVQQLLVAKSNKHNIYDQTEFDPAYNIADPEIAQAVRLGKRALRDQHIMTILWDKFKNQNKIATLLGVNRSSVNRRCQKYNLN